MCRSGKILQWLRFTEQPENLQLKIIATTASLSFLSSHSVATITKFLGLTGERQASSRSCPSLLLAIVQLYRTNPNCFLFRGLRCLPLNSRKVMTAHCFNPTATMKQSRYFPQKIRLEGMFAPKKPIFCWLAHVLKAMKLRKFRSRPSYRLEITLIELCLKKIKYNYEKECFGKVKKTLFKRCGQTVMALLTGSKELQEMSNQMKSMNIKRF